MRAGIMPSVQSQLTSQYMHTYTPVYWVIQCSVCWLVLCQTCHNLELSESPETQLRKIPL